MKEFDELVKIMETLRNKCPWDMEQTHESIMKCTIDETYELLDAIEDNSAENMREELGDVLLQVVFHSQIAKENKKFNISDVISDINQKLIRRHPHIYGSTKANTSKEVLENWDKIKQKEKSHRKSALDGVPRSLPALLKAEQIQKKAAKTGFDWKEIKPVIEKLMEEIDEFKQAVKNNDIQNIDEEIGDILFSTVNIARHFNISAEKSLRNTIDKFSKRFRYVEKTLKENGTKLEDTTLEKMDNLWDISKTKNL